MVKSNGVVFTDLFKLNNQNKQEYKSNTNYEKKS
ncbi:hypothetical protein SAMN06265377_1379 [Flagellimonas pacifica]|uniref:Uncharacterized protein n=1 Tax=Flagellimonas pacifica TaxID=1247520 RepID=A0A285MQZ9_9FLAO|nr:hypothetical protein SAMN06265377_1379 [Allomuricauda parva]